MVAAAAQFDGAEYFTGTADYPEAGPITVTCWIWHDGDAYNTWETVWSFGVPNDRGFQLIANNGGLLVVNRATDFDGVGGFALPGDVWYRVAVVYNPVVGDMHYYHGPEGGPLTTFTDPSWADMPAADSQLRIGRNWYSDYWNGRIANFKIHYSVLSEAEVEAEFGQYAPAGAASLHAAYFAPTTSADLTQDYSGNGNHLSGGSTITAVDGPPSLDTTSGTTATASAPLGGLTASAAGTVTTPTETITGTGAGLLGALTAHAEGSVKREGDLAGLLGGLTATVTGQVSHQATAAALLGALTATATGHTPATITGTASAVLGALTALARGYTFEPAGGPLHAGTPARQKGLRAGTPTSH